MNYSEPSAFISNSGRLRRILALWRTATPVERATIRNKRRPLLEENQAMPKLEHRKPRPPRLTCYLLVAAMLSGCVSFLGSVGLLGGARRAVADDSLPPMVYDQRSIAAVVDDEWLDDDLEADYQVALDGDSVHVSDGFVFIDGQYLPPPYHVQFLDGTMRVNNRPINYPVPASLTDSAKTSGLSFAPGSHRGRISAVRRIGQELNSGGVLVSMGDHVAVWLHDPTAYQEFLHRLATPDSAGEVPSKLLESLPAVQRGEWQAWLDGYQPADDVQQRASLHLASMTHLERSNWAAVGAVRRLDHLAYPLTLLGMVIVVLASGHLLQNRPANDMPANALDDSPASIRLVTRSMLLVSVLSGLDLIWTLLAFQAGQMRELNPLGSRLIEDPLMLIAFKAAMTTLSVSLILALRKHRPAQVASWWACLICTLLTVRWLVFNSMFVA